MHIYNSLPLPYISLLQESCLYHDFQEQMFQVNITGNVMFTLISMQEENMDQVNTILLTKLYRHFTTQLHIYIQYQYHTAPFNMTYVYRYKQAHLYKKHMIHRQRAHILYVKAYYISYWQCIIIAVMSQCLD